MRITIENGDQEIIIEIRDLKADADQVVVSTSQGNVSKPSEKPKEEAPKTAAPKTAQTTEKPSTASLAPAAVATKPISGKATQPAASASTTTVNTGQATKTETKSEEPFDPPAFLKNDGKKAASFDPEKTSDEPQPEPVKKPSFLKPVESPPQEAPSKSLFANLTKPVNAKT